MDVQVSIPPPPPPPPPAFFAETTTPQLTSPPPPPALQPTTTTTSPPTQDRIWLHPWTVTEMRVHASQWSLAGDAGLLLYLEQFSDKLVQRADTIQQHLSQTVNAVKSTHTRVQNCLNEFTSLANTQFIESRVYDEDETENAPTSKKNEQSTEKANVSNTEAQEKVLQRYVEAIQYGLAILDTHFERVDPKSESVQNGGASYVDDDEDGGIPIEPILEPKDPYIFRPLPHLIGTTEFMQDDYVGLGDLLNPHDEDEYDAEPIEKDESDSAVSSSDLEDDDDVDDFKLIVSTVPLVPAGESRPDLANRTKTTNMLTDSESDDDDPFGMENAPKKFDDFSIDRTTEKDDMSGPATMPRKKEKIEDFSQDKDSDNEENNLFGIKQKKPPQSIVENDDFDKESTTSNESDEQPPPPKVMSELEKAVLRRRMKMGDPEAPPEDEEDDDSVKKPRKPPNQTNSLTGIETTPKPLSEESSSSTISHLASQPLTQPTIFGRHSPIDEDDNDIFHAAPKLNPLPRFTAIVDKKPPLIIPPKKEKDVFGNDSDEDGNPFVFSNKTAPPNKKNESNPKVQPTIIQKRQPIIQHDESDEDELFGDKKTKPKTIPPATKSNFIEKSKSPSSDDDLFTTPVVTKPPNSSITRKIFNNEDSSSTNKPPTQPVVPTPPAPTTSSSIKKPVSTAADTSDEELFGIKQTKPKLPTSETQKVTSPIESDEEDKLFSSEPSPFQLPPDIVLPPLPSHPIGKTSIYTDPLSGLTKPVEATPQPPRKTSLSDSDEELFPKKIQNAQALKPGEKPNVKGLAALLNIKPNAHTAGAARPKSQSITEEPPPPKPSLDDDDGEPIQKVEPLPTVGKKIPTTDSDSEDGLFTNKKKETPIVPVDEQKDKTNVASPGKLNMKELGGRIKLPMPPGAPKKPIHDSDSDDGLFTDKKKETPIVPVDEQKDKTNVVSPGKLNMKELRDRIKLPTPGAPQKPVLPKEKESNNIPPPTSPEPRNEESTPDKTSSNILIGRAKPPVRTQARPTRKVRSTAAASTNGNDDLFASPNSTPNVTSPPPHSPPAAIPVIPPPAAIPVIPPPAASVTGLLNTTTAIAAISDKSKEKKKFSLFDSDDSDIDDSLFGFNKKNKSPVVSKPTTTPSKVTPKASMLSLDDDDDDFLSQRPIKKNPKSVDNDDIFADVKGKGPQTNKAKKDWSIMEKTTGGTDDIFNESATATTKSSVGSKSKPTNVKNKPTKDLDDIFDDPLNVASKR